VTWLARGFDINLDDDLLERRVIHATNRFRAAEVEYHAATFELNYAMADAYVYANANTRRLGRLAGITAGAANQRIQGFFQRHLDAWAHGAPFELRKPVRQLRVHRGLREKPYVPPALPGPKPVLQDWADWAEGTVES
jgi:hypothetical protein